MNGTGGGGCRGRTGDICAYARVYDLGGVRGGGEGGHRVNTACRCGMSALLLVGLQCYSCESECLSLSLLGQTKLCKGSARLRKTNAYIQYKHAASLHPNPSVLPYRRLLLCVASDQLVG